MKNAYKYMSILSISLNTSLLISCRKNNPDSRPRVVTESNLRTLRLVIIEMDPTIFKKKRRKSNEKAMPINMFLNDDNVDSKYFQDGWRNLIEYKLDDKWMYLWSSGANGISENGAGDDILEKFDISEMK